MSVKVLVTKPTVFVIAGVGVFVSVGEFVNATVNVGGGVLVGLGE